MNRITTIIMLLLGVNSCQPSTELNPNAQPQIQDLRSSVVYNNDTDYFLLDVTNYHHDSTTVITLENLINDPTITYKIDQIWAETPTRLRVWINQRWPMKPGQYNITLTQSNNRSAKATQVVDVRPGRPRLDGFTRVSPGLAGQSVVIPGKNLFNSEELQLQLKDELGQTQYLSVQNFVDNGSTLTIDIATTIKPGYYGLILQASGLTYADCQRFSVLHSERQPYILGIDAQVDPYNVSAQSFCPDTATLTFERIELTDYTSLHTLTFGTTFFTNVSTFTAWILLTNIITKQTYRIPLQITDQYYGSWYDLGIQTKWFEGRYSINNSVSVGTYRLALEYIDKTTGHPTVSESYERLIRVN